VWYTQENVELNEVLLILGIFLPLFFVGVWQLNRINPNKKASKAGDSSIKDLYTVYNTQVSDILKLKDKAISSLNAKLRNFEEEPEEEEQDDSISPEDLSPILKEYGINPALLEIPMVKEKIKEFTQGMSITDLIRIATQFKKTSKGPELEPITENEKNTSGYF